MSSAFKKAKGHGREPVKKKKTGADHTLHKLTGSVHFSSFLVHCCKGGMTGWFAIRARADKGWDLSRLTTMLTEADAVAAGNAQPELSESPEPQSSDPRSCLRGQGLDAEGKLEQGVDRASAVHS